MRELTLSWLSVLIVLLAQLFLSAGTTEKTGSWSTALAIPPFVVTALFPLAQPSRAAAVPSKRGVGQGSTGFAFPLHKAEPCR